MQNSSKIGTVDRMRTLVACLFVTVMCAISASCSADIRSLLDNREVP